MAKAKVSSPAQKNKVRQVMQEFKRGTLKSSSGQKVTNPKQAMAIALDSARRLHGAQAGAIALPGAMPGIAGALPGMPGPTMTPPGPAVMAEAICPVCQAVHTLLHMAEGGPGRAAGGAPPAPAP